ncbi:unnamed protein product [Caenorhabditis sp. 36 PRJEB53466]|nr:unnamed protein product [Caenorhabditis sp. 36 PRJEB53466]
MFTIRKRSLAKPVKKIVGILRFPSSENEKKERKSVGFVDTIGKPLVEYRDLPPAEPTHKDFPHSFHHHQKTSGRLISTGSYEPYTKWALLPAKTARPVAEGPTEMGLIEAKRLEENGISRAPLFGTFETIELPHLHADAILRARAVVPIIPTDVPANPTASIPTVYSADPVTPTQNMNTYEQVFEQNGTTSSTSSSSNSDPNTLPSTNLFALMAQLKQRGLLPGKGQTDPVAPSVGLIVPPPLMNQDVGRVPRAPRVCTFYINKANGCNKGNSCRFLHDDQQRELRQKVRHEPYRKKDESWRRTQGSQPKPRHQKAKSRWNRSKSPLENETPVA